MKNADTWVAHIENRANVDARHLYNIIKSIQLDALKEGMTIAAGIADGTWNAAVADGIRRVRDAKKRL